MRVIAHFQDNEFPYNGYNHTRNIVRGIVYNDNFEIALIKLHTFDIFGERDLYETPGGGVEKGEKLIDAFKREIKEEVGAEIDNIEEIGRIVDFYNCIYRRNNNHFFLAHIKSIGEQHLTDLEKGWFEGVKYMSVDKAIYEYENSRDLPVNNIVRQRELPILKIAKKRLIILQGKSELRSKYIAIRQHIPAKMEKSLNIKEQLVPFVKDYKNIAVYASLEDEVDTFSLLKDLLIMDKNIYLPKVENDEIKFYKVSSIEELKMSKGKYRIKEPTSNISIRKDELEAIIVPGIAFDKENNRLGFGKGYYDKYLTGYKGYKIGICFKEQLLKRVPHSRKDIKMNLIITDK